MVRSRQSTPWYRWLKWGDYLLYLLIAISAILLFRQGPVFMRPVVGGQAKITVDGLTVVTISADKLAGTGQLQLEAHDFHYTVEYANGKVRISQADCPDQVCVQTGWVSQLGQVSACVPGHLILSVDSIPGTSGSVADGSETEVDVIVR